MIGYYILEGRTPKQVATMLEWGQWMETADRCVAKNNLINGASVSTVFLGFDHSFGAGESILFETIIFEGEHDGYQERYTSWDDAEKGHERALQLARGENKP